MLAAGLPGVVDLRLPGEPGRADSRVGEIDVARLGAEETRATGDVGDADEHVAGHAVVHRPTGLLHDHAVGEDRRLEHVGIGVAPGHGILPLAPPAEGLHHRDVVLGEGQRQAGAIPLVAQRRELPGPPE